MQGRLGLQQTPKPAGGAGAAPRVRGAPKSAPKRDGPLWRSVKVISDHATSPTLQCLNCGAKFCGGATRIRDHVTGLGSLTGCSCNTESFFDFKQKMVDEAEKASASKKRKVAEDEVDAAANAALPAAQPRPANQPA